MSSRCDLLPIFGAKDKLREKNSTINRLKNQILLLEENLKNKCEEITILHEQLFALSQRVDNLSTKRLQQIVRFTTSRSNHSTSYFDDVSSSALCNYKSEHSGNNNVKISKRLECIQKLTAKSPLNNFDHKLSCATSKTQLYEHPIYHDERSNCSNGHNFSINDIFATNSQNENMGITMFSTSHTSSDVRHCGCSDPNNLKVKERFNMPSILISPDDKETILKQPRKRYSHGKTNSFTYSSSLNLLGTISSHHQQQQQQLQSHDYNNLPSSYRHIIHELSNKIMNYMDRNSRMNDELKETFALIETNKNENITMNNVVAVPISIDQSNHNKGSILFIKYSYQAQMHGMSEDFVIYLNCLLLQLLDYFNNL